MSGQNEELVKNVQHYSYFMNDQIGKGFSSTVYRGKNNKTGVPVAIKVINLHKLSQKTMQELLESEIQIIKSISHPNVLTCQNVYVTINNCYIVTELCKGGDLASYIKKKGRLRGLEALKTMLDISRGYSHLSERDIIHRDIKPANILLHNGCGKIADFGFARVQKEGRKEKYNIGTPLYMSPQSLNSNFYCKKSDIWSLGIVFYEILQGRTPWDPKNEKQLKEMINQKKDLIFRIAVRDQLQTLIKKCLTYEYQNRISIQSIVQTLEQMIAEMMKEDKSSAYRETLTRRAPHALSCRDLNININPSQSISDKLKQPSRPLLSTHEQKINPKIYHQKGEKQSTLTRNRTEVSLNSGISVEQASRKNHYILKAGINFTRLIYKSFPRVQKLQTEDYLKLSVQAQMLSALQFMIKWLQTSIKVKSDGILMGLELYDRFKETRCYSKTLAVIEEYTERYSNFSKKMRLFLQNRQPIRSVNHKEEIKQCSANIKNCLKNMYVLETNDNHNIGIDYVISIAILLDLISNSSLQNFARTSFVEQIVDYSPVGLGSIEREELREKKNRVVASL